MIERMFSSPFMDALALCFRAVNRVNSRSSTCAACSLVSNARTPGRFPRWWGIRYRMRYNGFCIVAHGIVRRQETFCRTSLSTSLAIRRLSPVTCPIRKVQPPCSPWPRWMPRAIPLNNDLKKPKEKPVWIIMKCVPIPVGIDILPCQ